MSASKTAVPSRSHLTSLMYSLPVRRLKEILSHVVPDASLGAVEQVASTQLPRLYNLNMSDDRQLLLSFAPSLAVRLLRQEGTILSSEAILIYFISASTRSLKIEGSPSSETEIPNSTSLLDVVPKILKHSSNNREMAYPYSIFEPTAGAPLSTLSIYLSIPDRRVVDKQVGSMVRALALLTSPTGTFGTASRVLPDPFNGASSTAPPIAGSSTWSEAFNTLLEGILRDGEDMAVLLPYDTIRSHYQRLSFHLDTVTFPRLVVLDASSETNVMVERTAEEPSLGSSSTGAKFTGLRSWSQGVFGDPLLCEAFEDPSEGFLEGWQEGGEDETGDEVNLEIRSLFYRCYRASVGVVTQYYRPQVDSSRRELEARRKLTNVLAELARVEAAETSLLKRPRSPSGEAESAKRLKC
ncbi:Uncharacterized protein BP5553_08960 [Venustampulla echinocandica]|uniref:Aminoglycoside phosphotransferase domain-containing protein n=1 Tax=Venustampulla echinocandica TaxID=2656787 RepID=A0A370TDJ5_9HELO|nr:Uncharacterized protein BP5553_08960 [Venustampulla echinocandica]RDL32504.1 Uncharacterized protein BP5553_08960 [Venustampulla echinocandica]